MVKAGMNKLQALTLVLCSELKEKKNFNFGCGKIDMFPDKP